MSKTSDVVIVVRYDPDARTELDHYFNIADRAVIELGTLDPNLTALGAAVMQLVRKALQAQDTPFC